MLQTAKLPLREFGGLVSSPLNDTIAGLAGPSVCRPEGTVVVVLGPVPGFFDPDGRGVLVDFAAGLYHFRVERLPGSLLTFCHSHPGAGTRQAAVRLPVVTDDPVMQLTLVWHPDGVGLYVTPAGGEMVQGHGFCSRRQFRVALDGMVYELDATGALIDVYVGSQLVLEPPAIDSWRSTLQAVDIAQTGLAGDSLRSTVLSNMCLIMLVTGLENYLRSRFKEMEGEGLQPDNAALVGAFCRPTESLESVESLAADESTTVLRYLVSGRRINFQNYKAARRAYLSAYGLSIPVAVGDATVLRDTKRLLRFRHVVAHRSPMVSVLNAPVPDGSEAVVASPSTVEQLAESVSELVERLHTASLALRP